MTTATARKPYQNYLSAYRLKDGRLFLAKCSPVFYGHVTPGYMLDEQGWAGGETTIGNDEMDAELGQYGSGPTTRASRSA